MRRTYEQRRIRKMTEEELDELVHDLKGKEAAAINNSGKDAQLAYLLGEEN